MWSGIRKFVIFGQFRQWSRKKNDKRRSKQRKHKRFSGVIVLKEPENKKIQKQSDMKRFYFTENETRN